jgi:hypothetical protein
VRFDAANNFVFVDRHNFDLAIRAANEDTLAALVEGHALPNYVADV